MANDACGAPIPAQMCLPWTFFDGKLFHSKLIKATHARNLVDLCDGRVEMAYSIERMRDAIMSGPVISNASPAGRPVVGPRPKQFLGQRKKPNKVRFSLKLIECILSLISQAKKNGQKSPPSNSKSKEDEPDVVVESEVIVGS